MRRAVREKRPCGSSTRLALRRPYTFVVLAMLIVLIGGLTLARMPTDIFPEIDIPVVAAVWSYTGLPPQEVEGRVTSQFERAATTTVSGIEHIESQSLAGVAIVKIFLQPGTSLDGAVAEVGAISETILEAAPTGSHRPADRSLQRLGYVRRPAPDSPARRSTSSRSTIWPPTTVRPGLVTVRGSQMPLPVGGKVRQIVVDLDLEKLYAWGLSPADVSAAVNVQNLTLPSGTAKMGNQEYPILINSSPSLVEAFNDLPIKTVRGTPVYLRDIAHVRDGYARRRRAWSSATGPRARFLPVLKSQRRAAPSTSCPGGCAGAACRVS